MIVKGLIKTINFSDNSCTVRLPIFETAASQGEVILKAVMLTQPGLYNGYSEGDIVFVDFENDKLNQPIILGKLYLGAAKEEASPVHSSLAVSNLTVTSKATLPIDTQLVLEDTGNTVAVENGITTYKSLTDIIKALYKTEASVDKTTKDQAETIANIKVEYLSQLASQSPPEATDTNWDISTPDYKDGFAIWQKTTCYNHRGQVLSREIICLNSINSSATYRLRCSTRVHAGASQTEKLIIKAMVKIGSSLEVEDASAILKYKWSGEDDKDATIEKKSSISFSNSDLEDKNLIVELLHEDLNNPGIYNTYDTDTIMYAPLNTPVIHFSKDTDVILYTADGKIKLGDDVENTAELYINGDILPAEFTWSWVNCTCDYNSETNPDPKTIIVTGFTPDSRTGIATCKAKVTQEGAFKDKEYEKEFAVTQTRVGENATSYWLVSSCTVHTGKKHGEAITITAMQQFGTSTEGVDIAARLWWKYKNKASNSWKLATDKDEDGEDITYRLVLAFNDLEDDDILVLATHDITFDPTAAEVNIATDPLVYEREEITFSPLNTPILSLTNDSGAILYGSNGQKMNPDDTISTTAELYLNGTQLPDENITYNWTLVNCTIKIAEGKTEEESLASPTITIEDLSENTASATCTATYKDEPYTKAFTVVKQVQGVSIVSQTTYYALIRNDFAAGDITTPTFDSAQKEADLTVYIQTGDNIITKRPLKRLDQAITSADIDEAETWSDWSTTPPAHTEDTNGWKFWTTIETIYSSGTVSFSNPIINEDLSGVYALAQGKSTNYYSDEDPSEHYTIKEGDCWFDTGYNYVKVNKKLDLAANNDGTFDSSTQYIGYYYNKGTEESPEYQEITSEILKDNITEKVTIAYKREKDCLKQWSGGEWVDVGEELVANKVTAKYINALDITAKKIKILNDDGNTTLFEADGLDNQHKVTIGGFEVNTTGLYTAGAGKKTSLDDDDDDKPGVYIGADGISIGKGFKVEAGDNGDTQVTLSEEVSEQISAVSYWISSTCTVHTGSKHGQAIVVTAMKKVGNAEESQDDGDNGAYLWWRYKNTSSTWTLAAANHRINFTFPSEVPDDDILIIATHNSAFDPNTPGIDISTDENIYEREEIPFSPLNTPILNLTNDSGALAYNGNTKIGSDTVSTTAELWLNGVQIESGVTYKWSLTDCATDTDKTGENAVTTAELTIKTLTANTATATCTATVTQEGPFSRNSYTKTFTITKQLKGDASTVPGPAGRSVLSTIKYYKLTNTTPEDIPDDYAEKDPPVDWYSSPETFTDDKEGYDYYETVRTEYNTADDEGHYYSWSKPVKNAMLTVDFLNALGITAKKIEVVTDKDAQTGESKVVFSADGLNRNTETGKLEPIVQIGGFKVTEHSIETNEKDETEKRIKLTSDGGLFAKDATLSGAISARSLKIGNTTVTVDSKTQYGEPLGTLGSAQFSATTQISKIESINLESTSYQGYSAGLIANIKLDKPLLTPMAISLKIRVSYNSGYGTSAGTASIPLLLHRTLPAGSNLVSVPLCWSGTGTEGASFNVGGSGGEDVCEIEGWFPNEFTTYSDFSSVNTEDGSGEGLTFENILPVEDNKFSLGYLDTSHSTTSDDYNGKAWASIGAHSINAMSFYQPSTSDEQNRFTGDTLFGNYGEFNSNDSTYTPASTMFRGNVQFGEESGYSPEHRALLEYTDERFDELGEVIFYFKPQFKKGLTVNGTTTFNPGEQDILPTVKGAANLGDLGVASLSNVDLNTAFALSGKVNLKAETNLKDDNSVNNDTSTSFVLTSKNKFYYKTAIPYFKEFSPISIQLTSGYRRSGGGIGNGTAKIILNGITDEDKGAVNAIATFDMMDGTIKFMNGIFTNSDSKIKNTIQPLAINQKYEKLFDNLRPVSYKLNTDNSDRTHFGLIAQELKQSILDSGLAIADVAAYGEWELDDPENQKEAATCGIRYEELIALNIHEIQKLKKRVTQQDQIIADLTQRLEKLENNNN